MVVGIQVVLGTREGTCSNQYRFHDLIFHATEAVSDDDGYSASGDGCRKALGLWRQFFLRKPRCFAAMVGPPSRIWRWGSNLLGHGCGEIDVDIAEAGDQVLVHSRVVAVIELETERSSKMDLFDVGERVVEKLSLAEVFPKLGRVQTLLHG